MPDLHVVARRQLDRHERRLARADERQHADDRSQPRRQRGLRDHPRRQEERLRDSRRRIAEEFLPAGPADALGGLRHSQGRQRVLHPDHDRPGRLGRPVRRDAVRGRELGQGQSRRAARHGRRLLRFDDRVSAVLRVRGRRAQSASASARSSIISAKRSSPTCDGRRRRRRGRSTKPAKKPTGDGLDAADGMGTLASELGPLARARSANAPRVYADANVPARARVASCARSSAGTCCSCSSTTTCAARRDIEHFRLARHLGRTLITLDRDYLDDRRFPPDEGAGVLVFCARRAGLRRLLAAPRSRRLFRPERRRRCGRMERRTAGVAHRLHSLAS